MIRGRIRSLSVAVLVSWGVAGTAGAQEAPKQPVLTIWVAPPLGPATKAQPLKWKMVDTKGKLTAELAITNLAPWAQNETATHATKRKALAFRKTINAKFPGSAELVNRLLFYQVGGALVMYKQFGVDVKGFKGVILTGNPADPTRQPGNGLKLRWENGGALPGKGSMQRSPGSSMSFSTGVDPLGNQSVVMFGLVEDPLRKPFDRLIAVVEPAPSMSDLDVLVQLQSQLFSKGLSSTLDPVAGSLTLDALLNRHQTLFWASTDTGLSLGGSLVVPSPGSAALLLAGATLAVVRRRRHTRA